jgi:uncharacterized protein (TIGR03790 family)
VAPGFIRPVAALRLVLRLCVGALLAIAPDARALDARHLGLVVNVRDPLSVEIARHYAARRGIVFQNVIRVEFEPGRGALGEAEFAAIRAAAEAQALPHIQAYALAWAAPYRVECMSVTSAFAFGFDRAWCAEGCKPTRASPYFMSRTRMPFAEVGMRPAMAIAAGSLEQAKALIDRGVAADGSQPAGTAYLLSTSDANRNVRKASYPQVRKLAGRSLRVSVLESDALRGAQDVLFYFTGRAHVEGLETLRFLPGAIADHLTSAGGQLTENTGQMSALRWLEAGATGSYGTVVEPCNMVPKFPHPPAVVASYLRGETLIEAYWKSVRMPGQGIFIGEPLAAPFRARAAN